MKKRSNIQLTRMPLSQKMMNSRTHLVNASYLYLAGDIHV